MEEKRKDELRQAFIKSGLTKEEWKVACKYLNVDALELAEICAKEASRIKDKSISNAMLFFVKNFIELSNKYISKEEIQNVCNTHNYLYKNNIINIYDVITICANNSAKNNISFIAEIRKKLKIFQEQAKKIFEDSGFQKRHIRRIISEVPPDQWDLRIQNARMRQNRSEIKQLKLANGRLTNVMLNKEQLEKKFIGNSPDGNDEFFYEIDERKRYHVYLETDDVMPFIDLVVLSAVYTLIDAGYKVITVKDIWETTHFTGEWDNVKLEQRMAFMKIIDDAKKRLQCRHIMTKTYDGKWNCTTEEYGMFVENGSYFLGKLGYTDNADVVFVITNTPEYYRICKIQRLASIPNKLLASKNCKIDWLEKIYIARRIVLSGNQNNKIVPIMKWEKADTELGKKIDRERAKGYMRFLKKAQLIEDYTATASKLEWKTVLQIGKATSEKSLVILEDENGNDITADAPKPEKIERVEAELRAYNDYLACNKVVLNETELDCSLRAKYNRGSYDLGGRMYTTKEGHQRKKTERKQITINGNATIEIDFSCYHTNMLYNLQGLPLEGDAYDFADDRQKAKRVLNTCLDAKNETKAKCSIASYLRYGDNYKGEKKYEEIKVFIPEAEELMRKAEIRHAGIKGRFYTDNALSLQNLDAEIMLTIIDDLRRNKILALPVHDSIIVEKKNLAKAKKTMEKVYKKRMGFDCRIKVEE